MFFVKLNLDELGHDMAIMDKMPSEAYEAWLRGFNKGSRGIAPVSEGMEPGDMGQRMGYKAFVAAQAFSASRAANRAGGSKKREERRENPEESSVTSSDPHMMRHMSQDMSSGGAPQTPASSRNPYLKCDAKFAKPEAVLSFEQTPAGIAALAKRAEIKARLAAKKEQHVS
jgi:hypothetical protein